MLSFIFKLIFKGLKISLKISLKIKLKLKHQPKSNCRLWVRMQGLPACPHSYARAASLIHGRRAEGAARDLKPPRGTAHRTAILLRPTNGCRPERARPCGRSSVSCEIVPRPCPWRVTPRVSGPEEQPALALPEGSRGIGTRAPRRSL